MDRKIMVEVSPEEYRKIVAGALDISSMSNDEIVYELIKRSQKEVDKYKDYQADSYVTVIRGRLKVNDKTIISFTVTTNE